MMEVEAFKAEEDGIKLHHGMHKLMRRSGIMWADPGACEEGVKALRRWLKGVIEDAAELSAFDSDQKRKVGKEEVADNKEKKEEDVVEIKRRHVLDALAIGRGCERRTWINQKEAAKCEANRKTRRAPKQHWTAKGRHKKYQKPADKKAGKIQEYEEEKGEEEWSDWAETPEEDEDDEEEDEEDISEEERKEDEEHKELEWLDDIAAKVGTEWFLLEKMKEQERIEYKGFPSLFDLCCGVIVRQGISEAAYAILPEEVQQRLLQHTPWQAVADNPNWSCH